MKETRMAGIAAVGVALLAGGLAQGSKPVAEARVPATIEMAEKERRSCVTCHTAFGRPELNEIGEYYQRQGTLEGYPGELPPPEEEPEPEPEPER